MITSTGAAIIGAGLAYTISTGSCLNMLVVSIFLGASFAIGFSSCLGGCEKTEGASFLGASGLVSLALDNIFGSYFTSGLISYLGGWEKTEGANFLGSSGLDSITVYFTICSSLTKGFTSCLGG